MKNLGDSMQTTSKEPRRIEVNSSGSRGRGSLRAPDIWADDHSRWGRRSESRTKLTWR